jgi:capsule polysaccharide export protein KpsE/RkpR
METPLVRSNQASVLMPQEALEPLQPQVNGEGWPDNAFVLWHRRRILLRTALWAIIVSTAIAFLIPKEYESTTRIMPPDQQGGSAAMLAAMLGKALPGGMGGMTALAGSLFGMKNTGALFVDLLQSGTIRGHVVEQFDLQKVYRKRYRQDAVKKLSRRTEITEDRKSGVITIVVTDTDRRRARDMAQAYVDQLDQLVVRVNTSSARREREFIEHRLVAVQQDLEKAQIELSEYSSKNTTLDIKEQTRAMVDAGAKLQGQLIVAQSEVGSLEQIYTPGNIRVRAAQARVAELERDLKKMSGQRMTVGDNQTDASALYPSLRQLPILGVQWADLYRRVKIQETVFDLLTEQYETARIEEAKSIPIVSVIDPPSWPEKKSFPPRLLLIVALTGGTLLVTSAGLLLQHRWQGVSPGDSRKLLAREIQVSCKSRLARLPFPRNGTSQ